MYVPFVGPSYEARSKNIDAERCINMYCEKTEVEDGKSKISLISCSGKKPWIQLPQAGVRGSWLVPGENLGVTDRLFAVASNTLYEIMQNGTVVTRGTLRTTSGFVGLSNNNQQLMITDGVYIYILCLTQFTYTIQGITGIVPPAGSVVSTNATQNTSTVVVPANTFTTVLPNTTDDQGNPNSPLAGSTCCYMDSYLITHKNGTATFGISDNNNGLSWDGLDQAQKEGSPDQIVAVAMFHRNLVLFGQYTSEIWYDSGSTTFPFAPIQGVFMETGCAAPFSVCNIDNTIYWVGYDKKGWGMVFKLNGYLPQRISTHAIEKMINETGSAPLINSYAYQEEGHSFIVINAPNLGTTLVYDAATQLWHERQSIDFSGNLNRDCVGFHSFAFGQHILFDYQTADVYIGSVDFYTDGAQPLRRIRVSPHMHKDLKYIFFRALQIDMETGVGLDGNPAVGTNPQAILKYSNDGGYTFGNEIYRSLGAIGQKKTRVRYTNLGRARDRVWWFEVADPVKVVIMDATLDALEGNS